MSHELEYTNKKMEITKTVNRNSQDEIIVPTMKKCTTGT